MIRKIFIIYLLIISCNTHAWCSIDSLNGVLAFQPPDTTKVNLLNQLSKEYYLKGKYDSSRMMSNKAYVLGGQLNFQKGQALALIHNGVTSFYEGDYPAAIRKYQAALLLSKKINDQTLIANCYNNLGLAKTYQSRYIEAINLHKIALKYYTELHDSAGIGKSYNNLGIIFEEQGDYAAAIRSYLSSLTIAELRQDHKSTADAFFNLGNVYNYQKNSLTAIRNYIKALSLYHQTGFKHGVALCYVNMAQSYQQLDSLEVALDYSVKAYNILESIGSKVTAAQTKNVIAEINGKLGNYKQAMSEYLSALKLFMEIHDTLNMSTSYRGIGDIHLRRGEYDEALVAFQHGLRLAIAVNFRTNIAGFYGSISEVYYKKHEFENAFKNHKLYFAYNDSLINESQSRTIAEMQARYESEKKDHAIHLLNKEKELQKAEIRKQKFLKYAVASGFILFLLLMIILYRSYHTRQRLKLQDLRNKISSDLHDDIGSTLNSISIYSEVARRNDERQNEALDMIGEVSRNIIDTMSDIVWTVNPDNDSFDKIIFRMRSFAYNLFRAKNIEYTFHVNDNLGSRKLPMESRRNFYLIFKEAINNMVKYSQATRADINLSYKNRQVILRIRDNGIGFKINEEISGNGLKNMNRRAHEMYAILEINSNNNGTEIILTLNT